MYYYFKGKINGKVLKYVKVKIKDKDRLSSKIVAKINKDKL